MREQLWEQWWESSDGRAVMGEQWWRSSGERAMVRVAVVAEQWWDNGVAAVVE